MEWQSNDNPTFFEVLALTYHDSKTTLFLILLMLVLGGWIFLEWLSKRTK